MQMCAIEDMAEATGALRQAPKTESIWSSAQLLVGAGRSVKDMSLGNLLAGDPVATAIMLDKLNPEVGFTQ